MVARIICTTAVRLDRDAYHSHPSSAKVKNTKVFTSPRPVRVYGVVVNYAHGQFHPLTCKKGKGKVVPVLNYVPCHEDVYCT